MFSLFPLLAALTLGGSRTESLSDSVLIEKIWTQCSPSPRTYAIANDWNLATAPTSDSVVLYINGTGHCQMPATLWRTVDSAQALGRIGPAEPTSISPLWQSLPRMLRNWESSLLPTSGLTFHTDGSMGVSKGSGYVRVLENQLQYSHPITKWATLGILARRYQPTYRFQTDSVSSAPGTRTWTSFGVKLCGPIVCYLGKQQSAPLTDNSWLQSQLDTLVQNGSTGNLIHRWKTPGVSAVNSNWEHSLYAQFSKLHWEASWDRESWDGFIQEVSLQKLPAGALQWGILLGWHEKIAWTGFTLGSRPLTWTVSPLANRSFQLRVVPVQLAVRYRNLDQASVHAGLEIHFAPSPTKGQP